MVSQLNLEVKGLSKTSRVREALSRVKKNGSRYIVTENGEPVAMLLPLAGGKPKKKDQEKAWQELFQLMESVQARNAHISVAEVEADVEAAIREIRSARK